jgi:transcriptional regulator with GAF, ATPase, and Fis domain
MSSSLQRPDSTSFGYPIEAGPVVPITCKGATARIDIYDQLEEARAMLAEATLFMSDGFRQEPNDDAIIGESSALKEALRQVEVVAPTDATVLLQGETGTGKERLAHAVHQLSARRDHPFVRVNCAAMPAGLRKADGSGVGLSPLGTSPRGGALDLVQLLPAVDGAG